MRSRVSLYICLAMFIFSSPSHARLYIVTGASGGLGGATAKLLAKEGHNLLLLGRTKAKLKDLQQELSEQFHHLDIQYQSVDYTNSDDLGAVHSQIAVQKQNFNGILIVTPRPKLDDHLLPSSVAWRQMFEEGFIGPLELLKTILPRLSEMQKWLFYLVSLQNRFCLIMPLMVC